MKGEAKERLDVLLVERDGFLGGQVTTISLLLILSAFQLFFLFIDPANGIDADEMDWEEN